MPFTSEDLCQTTAIPTGSWPPKAAILKPGGTVVTSKHTACSSSSSRVVHSLSNCLCPQSSHKLNNALELLFEPKSNRRVTPVSITVNRVQRHRAPLSITLRRSGVCRPAMNGQFQAHRRRIAMRRRRNVRSRRRRGITIGRLNNSHPVHLRRLLIQQLLPQRRLHRHHRPSR